MGAICPNGWCWPTGKDNTRGYYHWHSKNSAYAGNHLAQDIGASEGDPVYAIADGKVVDVNDAVADYGGVNIPGGGVIIDHETANGERFETLNAHLKNIVVSPGENITKGQKIGEIRSYYLANGSRADHLHFGVISPSKGESNAYRWTGYWTTDVGFTNPITFLNTHSPATDVSSSTSNTDICGGNQSCEISTWGWSTGEEFAWFPKGECMDATAWFRITMNPDGTVKSATKVPPYTPCQCR